MSCLFAEKERCVDFGAYSTFNAIISRAVQANILSLVSQIMTFVLFKINAGMYFFLNDVILCKVRLGVCACKRTQADVVCNTDLLLLAAYVA